MRRHYDGGVDDPNHLLAPFPVLFPYGLSGFEVDRPVKVSYEEYTCWALQYSDNRFRLDPHFPFQIFGVLQKQRICSSAHLQMKRSSFNKSKLLLSKLKAKDFEKVALKQAHNQLFSNPAMIALKKQLSTVRSRVPGMDEARRSLQAKINGTTAMKGPPSLWLTINPADSTNPIAQVHQRTTYTFSPLIVHQVLAGVDINLDKFVQGSMLLNDNQHHNISKDPYASAEFFHTIICTVLKDLIGFDKGKPGHFKCKISIFGRTAAYVGSVEAQGCGTLHLHILIWLEDAPTAPVMEAALADEHFRQRMKEYIASSVQASIYDYNGKTMLAMPQEPLLLTSTPAGPSDPDYDA